MTGRASVLALGIAVVVAAAPSALAQVGPDLRGPVAEGIPSPPYEPASDDPLADPLAQPLGDEVAAGSAQPRRRPSGVATQVDQAATARPGDETLVTGTVRTQRLDSLDEGGNRRSVADNDRVPAIDQPGLRREDAPFSPIGLRLGSFNVTTRLDQGLGWTSNASSSPGGDSSIYSETGLRLEAISDWSRHSATMRADGTFRKSLSGERISEPEGGVDGEIRFDLGNEFTALAALGYRLRQESASDPNALSGTASRPLRHTLNGRAGVSKDIGKVRVGVTGDVVRDVYGDAELLDGSVLSQGGRDSTLVTGALRLGYELSPALRPFVEGEIGRRLRSDEVDAAGFERSADRYAMRGGVELDLNDKLRGELSAGWLTEKPDDERLEAISGGTVAAALAWSPVRGTTVELNASTQVEASTTPGDSGSLLYSGGLAVSRELRADLTGKVLAGLDLRDYSAGGRDLVTRGEASLTWWMNRNLGVTGRARHEIQQSTLPDRDYSATSLYLGMTLQR